MFAVGWGANQFAPMLVVYRDELGLSAETRALLFGIYAAGLIPGLLLGGGASDRVGRRRVVLPAVALSPLASLVLVVGREEVLGLAAGRLLAGICSGIVFGAASAWVRELSAGDPPGTGARRAAIALSAGFGTGPLVAGLVAEWAPHPLWVPYLPHVVLGVLATLVLAPASDATSPRAAAARLVSLPAACRRPAFLLGVAPMAPWVFGSAAIAFAVLPAEVATGAGGQVALAGALTGLTLATGVLIQPLARRLDDGRPLAAGQLGLVSTAVGTAIGVLALQTDARLLLLPAGIAFGAGYGLILVSGLRETERLASPTEHGATVAIYYAVTYLGFAAPYVLGLLDDLAGREGALAVAGVVALLCVLPLRVAAARPRP